MNNFHIFETRNLHLFTFIMLTLIDTPLCKKLFILKETALTIQMCIEFKNYVVS